MTVIMKNSLRGGKVLKRCITVYGVGKIHDARTERGQNGLVDTPKSDLRAGTLSQCVVK